MAYYEALFWLMMDILMRPRTLKFVERHSIAVANNEKHFTTQFLCAFLHFALIQSPKVLW